MRIDDLKDFIANGRIDEALNRIIKLTTYGLQDNAYLMKYQWTDFEKKYRAGRINNEAERNRIIIGILHFIDKIQTQTKGETGYNLKPFFTS